MPGIGSEQAAVFFYGSREGGQDGLDSRVRIRQQAASGLRPIAQSLIQWLSARAVALGKSRRQGSVELVHRGPTGGSFDLEDADQPIVVVQISITVTIEESG